MDVESLIEDAIEFILGSPAYNPAHATAQESLDFLQGVQQGLQCYVDALNEDLA
jgi:hypothetical protein